MKLVVLIQKGKLYSLRLLPCFRNFEIVLRQRHKQDPKTVEVVARMVEAEVEEGQQQQLPKRRRRESDNRYLLL